MTHTPAPWIARKPNSDQPHYKLSVFYKECGRDKNICMVSKAEMGFREGVANCYLIAAAPELLKWLIDHRAELKKEDRGFTPDFYTEMDALIAKATGVVS